MFLGIDVGTSEVKALLLSEDHRVIDTAGSLLALSRPHPGHSEQNPADWWTATCTALAALRNKNPKAYAAVRAIGRMELVIAFVQSILIAVVHRGRRLW